MKRCIRCLREHHQMDDKCSVCQEDSLFSQQNKTYTYQHKQYNRDEWLIKWGINTSGIIKPIKTIHPSYQAHLFWENCKKHTKINLIYPSIFFLVASIIIAIGAIEKRIRSMFSWFYEDLFLLALFFFLIFATFSFLLLIKYGLKKEMCYLKSKYGQRRMERIKKEEVTSIIHSLLNATNEQIVFINTKRLTIRAYQLTDAFAHFECFRNKKVCKYLAFWPFRSFFQSVDAIYQAMEDIQSGLLSRVAITRNDTHEYIGHIGLSKIGLTNEGGEVVYAFSNNHWGMGFATEALEAFVSYLINEKNKQWVLATHMKQNKNSGKVMQKAGFVRAHLKDRMMNIRGKEEQLVAYIYHK